MNSSQDLGFRSKLVFENLLFITPMEMEQAIGLDFKLPNYADMVDSNTLIINKKESRKITYYLCLFVS